MNIKSHLLLTLTTLIWAMFGAITAQANEILIDCQAVNHDFLTIKENIAQGKFRFINDNKAANAISFSFNATLPFDQYLNYASKLIEAKNPQANRPCPLYTQTYQLLAKQNNWQGTPTVSQLIAPFELKQPTSTGKALVNAIINAFSDDNAKEIKKGVLLIHGLTDSPYLFHDLALFYYQQGFTVRTLLLPGHGTAASDLIDVSYEQWQQAARYGINRMVEDFDQVYLAGFSTGGALIFDHLMGQEQVSDKIKGLFIFSPASKAKSDLAWLAKYVDLIPFVDWIDLDADIDFAKYESFPYNAGAQVHALMSRIVGDDALKNRKMHNIPLFVVASKDDQTINTEFTLRLMNDWQQGSTLKSSTLKTSTLLYFSDDQSELTTNKKLLSLAEQTKIIIPQCQTGQICEQVLSISHTSPTNSPENPHYGINGGYRNCGHYLSDMKRYQQCKQSDEVLVGETTSENTKKTIPLKRLTYNPYYQQMLAEMRLFLDNTNRSAD